MNVKENKDGIDENSNNIRIIRDDMQQHFKDDEESFGKIDVAFEELKQQIEKNAEENRLEMEKNAVKSQKVHLEILAEVKLTNGRVRGLERDRIIRDTQLRIIAYALTTIVGVATAVIIAWLISVIVA